MTDLHSAAVPPPEVVEAFTSAAMIALQELTQIDAIPLPAPPTADAIPAGQVVSASVRLIREIPGTMTLVLASAAASRLAARYLPAGTTLSDEIVDDVLGEFANVIAGQSKTALKGTPYHFTLSTPVVVRAASFARLPEVVAGALVASLAMESDQLLLCVDLGPQRAQGGI